VNVTNEISATPRWTQSKGEELANSISHAIGFVAALVAAPMLILAALAKGGRGFFVGTIVFAITLFALYLSSMLYHGWPRTRTKYVLQIFDHVAIFLLIAGTYTPFALGPLYGKPGLTILGVVWVIAIFGIILKIARGAERHPKLGVALYLVMGWVVLIIARPVVTALPGAALFWLLAGGVAYTTGVLFYANKRLRYAHFVWHLFVLTGTSCHFLALFACTA
jgi:hemolysin III